MTNNIEDEIRSIVAGIDNQDNGEQQNQPIEDVYIFVVREHEVEEDQPNIVESEPVKPTVSAKQPFDYMTLGIVLICCIPMLASILFQFYLLQNPPIATITIIPKSQQVTLSGTLQLGRLLQPITISQSQTVATTGHGHQDARAARGTITFYNGQMNSIFVPAGLILTGNDGAQIVTDQDASIPASNLPQVGQVIVSAHAINPGSKGNIAAYDINQGCCATAIKAVNTNSFYGGQDERTYTTVTQKDIHSISTMLKTTIESSITGALQGQLRPQELLYVLPCTPTVSSDHPIGAQATQVNVTVSATCSAVAYNSQELQTKAAAYLASQALHKPGAGYSLFGEVHVSVTQASVTSTTHPLVFLSFKATGTWIYGLSTKAQEQIKHLIAGKTTQEALTLLASSKGIEQASIRLSGFGDATRLPKTIGYIRITIFVV